MSHVFSRLFFSYSIAVPAEKAECFLNLFLEKSINSWGYKRADNKFFFSTDKRGLLFIKSVSNGSALILLEEPHGLLSLLQKERHRSGLLLGGLFALLFFLLTSGLVWDIRITGAEGLSEAEIYEELASAGLSCGTPISSFDRAAFSANLLTSSEKISFVGVNFNGSVAYVQIMERKDPEKTPTFPGGANLVASQDAVIERLSVIRGEICVGRGDVVKKGELLVGGVTEGAGVSRFVYAAGEVFGRVEHTLSVTVPRTREKIAATEEQMLQISLKIFGKTINIYQYAGNLPPTYDTIYKETPLTAIGGQRLPFSLVTCRAQINTYVSETPPDAETVRYAEETLAEELSAFLKDKELLRKDLHGVFGEHDYTLTATLLTRENIAVTQEFSLSGEKQP